MLLLKLATDHVTGRARLTDRRVVNHPQRLRVQRRIEVVTAVGVDHGAANQIGQHLCAGVVIPRRDMLSGAGQFSVGVVVTLESGFTVEGSGVDSVLSAGFEPSSLVC